MSISYNDVGVENIFMGYDGIKIKLQWYFSILNVRLAVLVVFKQILHGPDVKLSDLSEVSLVLLLPSFLSNYCGS